MSPQPVSTTTAPPAPQLPPPVDGARPAPAATPARVTYLVPPHTAIGNFPSVPGSFATVGGTLWFSTGNKYLGRVNPDGSMTLIPTDPVVPQYIAAGKDGNIWFTDNVGYQQGYKVGYVTASGEVHYFWLSGASPADFSGLAVGPDGALWFLMWGGPDGQTEYLGRATAAGAEVHAIGNVPILGPVVGPDGSLWGRSVTGLDHIGLDGTVTSFAVPDGWMIDTAPAVGADGSLWVAATRRVAGGDGVLRLARDGTFAAFDLPTRFNPVGIAAGPDGALWIGSHDQGAVVRMSLVGDLLETIGLGNRGPVGPMAVGPDGDMWLTAMAFGDPGFMDVTTYLVRIAP